MKFVEAVDAILVSEKARFYGTPNDSGYVIVDGFHRWKAAKELGITDIHATIKNMPEAEAKAVNYRKNKERGTLDAYLEGDLFISEHKALTQAEIAVKYGVYQSYVSRRMSLAGFKPQADKIIESIKKELSANIEEVDNRIAGGDENAVFGNVGYHKRQAVDLRARLEDLGQDVMRRRITPSHLEEVISLKTPFFRIFFYLNSTLRTSDYPSSPSLRTFDVTYLVLNI